MSTPRLASAHLAASGPESWAPMSKKAGDIEVQLLGSHTEAEDLGSGDRGDHRFTLSGIPQGFGWEG